MIRLLSSKLADFLIRKKIVESDDKEIYIYGYEILISSLIGILAVVFLGLLLNAFWESIIFLVIFILIRQSCGGYHASSYVKCITSFLFVFSLIVFILNIFLPYYSYFIWLILTVICMSVIMYLSPMESIKKPLSKETKNKNRKLSIVFSSIVIVLSALLCDLDSRKSFLMMLTLVSICMLMMYEYLKGGAKFEEY